MPKLSIKRAVAVFIAVIITFSCFITASAQNVTQTITDFLSNIIVPVYSYYTEFSSMEIEAEIRRTVRGAERTGMLENIELLDDGSMEFDWLTLFYITDWLFKELVLEVSFRHGDNGFYENSENGYGYVFVGNGFTVEFPSIDEMDLIVKAIENNIVDWNPIILADTNGLIKIGGFCVNDIKRILSGGADDPPDEPIPPVTDENFKATVINRLDIMVAILLASVGVTAAVLFCYIIYRIINRFS
jgi:hypothetical protein